MTRKIKVLFVCLGNICRSPMAEAVFINKVKSQKLQSFFEIDSCGTASYHIGGNADPRTIAVAQKHGVITDHCVRQLTLNDLNHYDYILAMDHNNYQNILKLSPNHRAQIYMMREFEPQGKGKEVPDPYYGDERHFQEVYDILDRATEGLLHHIITTHTLSTKQGL